jgi:hypothetical protein
VLISIAVSRAFDFGTGVGSIGNGGFDSFNRLLRPLLRFESFVSNRDASNTASEEVRGLYRRFVKEMGSAASPRTRFERRARGIAPTIIS